MKRWMVCLFFLSGGVALSQSQLPAYDADRAFAFGRELAFSGQTGPARDTLRRILTDYPEYTDVETLLAKTYSWAGDFDTARRHLNRVTSRVRENEESWLAAIQNERYAGNTSLALGLANKALKYLGASQKISSIRAEILSQGNSGDTGNPGETERELPLLRNQITLENSFEAFDQTFEPMVYVSLEYTRLTKLGKIIPRVNYSNRFNIQGIQYELDLYPRLSRSLYAYLNYGYSSAPTYPLHRSGAELYAALPGAMEASAGIRHLVFSESSAILLTGSVGLYRGNYYFSARPLVSLFRDRDPGFSGSLLARKYLNGAVSYLGMRATYGFNPELHQLRSGADLQAEFLFYLESQHIQFEYQFTGAAKRNYYRAHLGVGRQEFLSDPGTFFWAFRLGIRYSSAF